MDAMRACSERLETIRATFALASASLHSSMEAGPTASGAPGYMPSASLIAMATDPKFWTDRPGGDRPWLRLPLRVGLNTENFGQTLQHADSILDVAMVAMAHEQLKQDAEAAGLARDWRVQNFARFARVVRDAIVHNMIVKPASKETLPIRWRHLAIDESMVGKPLRRADFLTAGVSFQLVGDMIDWARLQIGSQQPSR